VVGIYEPETSSDLFQMRLVRGRFYQRQPICEMKNILSGAEICANEVGRHIKIIAAVEIHIYKQGVAVEAYFYFPRCKQFYFCEWRDEQKRRKVGRLSLLLSQTRALLVLFSDRRPPGSRVAAVRVSDWPLTSPLACVIPSINTRSIERALNIN